MNPPDHADAPLAGDTVFDALIVGAGPSGAHLARLLARSGRSVALMDKSAFPRDKVCGGGLTPKALALLSPDLGDVEERRVGAAILNWRNREAVAIGLGGAQAVTVARRDFDALLLARARDAGAVFHAETRFVGAQEDADGVNVATSRGRLRCRLLFAADGAASAVRTAVFGRDAVRLAPALEALVYPEGGLPERLRDTAVFDFGAMPGGYGWIFPKRDHLNAGLYTPFSGRSPRPHLGTFLQSYLCLRQPARTVCQGYVIPVGNPRGIYQRGRVWLLGDAAGLAEALFGEGIYFALKSAELAARAVASDGLRPGSLGYTRLLQTELLPELRASARMARLFYRHPRRAYSHLVLNPAVARDFAGVIGGSLTYRGCLWKTALGLPRWLLPRRAAENPPRL
jgi:geranylgeranyl reductase family protein